MQTHSVHTLCFPCNKSLVVLAIALRANGSSSYRDASAIARLTSSIWGATVTILTDVPSLLLNVPEKTKIIHVIDKKKMLSSIAGISRSLRKGTDLLFSMSSHGWSTVVAHRKLLEMNGRSEFVKVGNEMVMDYELFDSLYNEMQEDIVSLCLIDTCHSGTMLDLEFISNDGIYFTRSKTPLRSRPLSVCISACSDNETAGEDVSTYAGWGGKLTCQFLDYANLLKPSTCIKVLDFYKMISKTFSLQSQQKSHPLISYNGK
jgi:hypothetical protein